MALPPRREAGAARRPRSAPRAERDGAADRGPVAWHRLLADLHRHPRCSRPSSSSTSAARSVRSRRPKARSPGTSCATSPSPTTSARSSRRPIGAADDESWKRRVEVWRDPRAIVGASDAGAHLDFLATFNYSTTMLAEAVRKRGLLATEEAVHCSPNAQARLYGLTGRGRLAEGWHADIVVFDESTVGPAPVVTRDDLPGGALRLYGEAEGIEHVLVNGAEIVEPASSPTRGPGVCCGQAATPRRSRCRAADHSRARATSAMTTEQSGPAPPSGSPTPSLTATATGPPRIHLPEADLVLPRPSAATGPTATASQHGKSRPARYEPVSVGGAESGQSASSTRQPAEPIIRTTAFVGLGNGSPPR